MRKNKIWTAITVVALLAIAVLSFLFINQRNAYATTKENEYNMAFYEVVEYVQKLKQTLKQNMIARILLYVAALLEPMAWVSIFYGIVSSNPLYVVNPYYVLWISFYACIVLWWIYDEGSLQWVMNYLVTILNVLIILMFVFVALIGGAFDMAMLVLIMIFPFAFPLALLTKSPLAVLIGCILITAAIGFWRYRKKSCVF